MGLCVCSHPLQEEASLMLTERGTCPPVQYLMVRGSNEIISSEVLQCHIYNTRHPTPMLGGGRGEHMECL